MRSEPAPIMQGRRIRSLAVVMLVVALVGAACSGDAADTEPRVVPEGDAAAFCRAWPTTRAALVDDFAREFADVSRTAVSDAQESLAAAEALVPGVLRSEWDAAVEYQRTAITLLTIAAFDPERLRPEIVGAAFGDAGPETAAAAAQAAV